MTLCQLLNDPTFDTMLFELGQDVMDQMLAESAVDLSVDRADTIRVVADEALFLALVGRDAA